MIYPGLAARIAAMMLLIVAVVPAQTDTVYFTAHGKDYHVNSNCVALSRAKTVFEASRKTAESHGLKPCPICARPRKPKTEKPYNDFGKPVPEDQRK